MPWVQVTLYTQPQYAEPIEALLFGYGASAVTLQDAADQPVFEPVKGTTPLWQNTRIMGLFEADIDGELLLQNLAADWHHTYPSLDFPSHQFDILEDKDWEREWMQRFEPMQFGPKFWVCPSWQPVPDPQAANLMLDPGLAFGTGSHPTTALCLQWLAKQSLTHQQVMDYGCGSGILALAALLLGAEQAHCIDNDDQALIATQDNAQRNHIDTHRMATYLPEQTPKTPVDILVANILANPLIQLASTLAALVKPTGLITLSGILENQANDVITAYDPWFTIHHVTQKEGWVRIDGIRH